MYTNYYILIYVLVFLIQTLFAEFQSRSALSGMSRDLFSVPRVYTPDFWTFQRSGPSGDALKATTCPGQALSAGIFWLLKKF